MRLIKGFILLLTLWSQGFGKTQNQHLVPEVIAILETHCLSCHNPVDKKGKLDLSDLKKVFSHEDLIIPHQPDKSLMIWSIEGDEPEMPPKGEALTPKQQKVLSDWIKNGALWPEGIVLKDNPRKNLDWWSLAPLKPVKAPQQKQHPVDAFIQEGYAKHSLKAVAEAKPQTLIRRLYYDLTGLPPTPHEIKTFVRNYQNKPELTWNHKIDELLKRSTFGEKWARHWLDIARYAESHGYDKDQPRENAWPYRDYVIESFNHDKAYSKFIYEQVAGDVIDPSNPHARKAVGFLAAGPWDLIAHKEVGEGKLDGRIAKHIDRDDMLSTTFNVFMSTTVQCAQCHHHKFDPIHMEDYYRLHAVFSSIDRAPVIYDGIDQKDIKDYYVSINRKHHLDTQIKKATRKTEEQIQKLKIEQKALNKKMTNLKPSFVYGIGTDFSSKGKHRPTQGKSRPIHVLNRGDIKSPGEQVYPGVPALWKDSPEKFYNSSTWKIGEERKKLAEYLGHTKNPLVWRSIVNRIWQWSFGSALVGTPNDFGRMGMKPTNETLLNYLAFQIKTDPKQSIKNIIRLLMSSKTYRLSSQNHLKNSMIDSNNQYFWKHNRRKLSAEEFRDSLLFISGKLNLKMYGPSFKDFIIEHPQHSPHYQYHLYDHHNIESHRRSIYRFIVRSQPHPFLTTLDCADASLSVPIRDETTTALQALTQWNNPFVEVMSFYFGERLKNKVNSDDFLEQACLMVLGRVPTKQEAHILTQEYHKNGPVCFSRILFNMSAFNYVD